MSDAENAALVIKEGVAQLFRPFQELLQQLLGPAATEVGGSLGDSLKMWRLGRQIKLLEKVKEMTKGKHINAVAPRLFFPILEAASIEADDDMQTRWAALLANEAIKVNSVHPSFVEILKQMSPEDARLLEKLYDWCKANNTSRLRWWLDSTLTLDEREKDTLENLFSLGFVETIYDFIQGGHRTTIVSGMPQLWSEDSKLDEQYMLTNTAFRFIEACRAPKCESSKTST